MVTTKRTFVISFSSICFALCLGSVLGMIAGYFGSKYEFLIMRAMDILLSFPAFFLAIAAIAIMGPGIYQLILIIAILYIPTFARVVYSYTKSIVQNTYIEAAKAVGKSNFRILFVELLPNCLSPIIVQATVTFADAIIIEAGLSFLGLSAQPPIASWGKMLNGAMEFMRTTPTLAIFPGIAISLSVLGFNLLGDGLRDVLDPRLRRGSV